MHEYSLITAIIEQSLDLAIKNHAKIDKLHIGLGVHSGVDAMLLKSAFDTFKIADPLSKDAVLEIKDIPIKLLCHNCGEKSVPEVLEYGQCPLCGDIKVEIVEGKDLFLNSVELEELDKE